MRVNPGELVTIAATFDGYTGRYMYHCHILDHEDHDMMRPFVVMPAQAMIGMAAMAAMADTAAMADMAAMAAMGKDGAGGRGLDTEDIQAPAAHGRTEPGGAGHAARPEREERA